MITDWKEEWVEPLLKRVAEVTDGDFEFQGMEPIDGMTHTPLELIYKLLDLIEAIKAERMHT